jgi:cytochrome c-type biogenesis protein CcmH/NrfF
MLLIGLGVALTAARRRRVAAPPEALTREEAARLNDLMKG